MSEPDIKNPGATAIATGASRIEETSKTLQGHATLKRPDVSISKNIPDDIKRASRAFGYALWLNSTDHWLGFKTILQARLSPSERAALAFVALKSLDPDDAVATADAALPVGMCAPVAPVFNHMDEAAFWADTAEPEALDAYCLASFNRMAPGRQAAFMDFVKGRAAA